MARLATRRAKPGGSYHLFPEEIPSFLAPLEIDRLHGFGWSTREKAEEKLGTVNLGELAKKSMSELCDALGKGTGETLYKALRGIDERKLESDKPRKSVSCEINVSIHLWCPCTTTHSCMLSMVSGSTTTSKRRLSSTKWQKKSSED